MANKVGAKGQLVIEKEIRDRLEIETGSLAIQRIVDDHVEIYFLPAEHNRSLKGSLAPYVKQSSRGKDWAQIKEEAWRAAAEERERPLQTKRQRKRRSA